MLMILMEEKFIKIAGDPNWDMFLRKQSYLMTVLQIIFACGAEITKMIKSFY